MSLGVAVLNSIQQNYHVHHIRNIVTLIHVHYSILLSSFDVHAHVSNYIQCHNSTHHVQRTNVYHQWKSLQTLGVTTSTIFAKLG